MEVYKKTSVSKSSNEVLLEEYIISDKDYGLVEKEFCYENERAICTIEKSSLEEIAGKFNGYGKKRMVIIF